MGSVFFFVSGCNVFFAKEILQKSYLVPSATHQLPDSNVLPYVQIVKSEANYIHFSFHMKCLQHKMGGRTRYQLEVPIALGTNWSH